MAFHLRSVVLAALCLILTLESSYAIKCIQCTSNNNPKCADLSDSNIQATECILSQVKDTLNSGLKAIGISSDLFKEVELVCFKTVTTNRTTTSVDRSCTLKSSANEVCDKTKEFLKTFSTETQLKYCGTCEKDGCNAASNIQYALPLLFVAPIFYALRLLA